MFYLTRFAKKFGRKVDSVSRDTMDRLMKYAWPGNIRELQNIIERSVVLSQGPFLDLDPALLPAALSSVTPGAVESPGQPPRTGGEASGLPAAAPASLPTLEEVERRHILATLERTRWVIEGSQGAARILKLHPNTLRSRMQKLGIRRPADPGP